MKGIGERLDDLLFKLLYNPGSWVQATQREPDHFSCAPALVSSKVMHRHR